MVNYGAILVEADIAKSPECGLDDGTHTSDDSLLLRATGGGAGKDGDLMNDGDDEFHQLSHMRRNSHRSLIVAGTASISSEVANMTKNLIGGGVLSLR